MRFKNQNLKLLLRTALVAWLVLAQFSVFAHEISHEPTSEAELCATCSIGSFLQSGACDSPTVVHPEPAFQPAIEGESPVNTEVSSSSQQARAPPHYS